MATIENPYNYRRAVLAENAEAGAAGAIPNLGKIAEEYTAAQGRIAAESQERKAAVALAEKKLAEQGRQSTARLAEEGRQFTTTHEEKGRQFSEKLNIGREQFSENLTEQDRKFTAKLDLDRQTLDTWKKQNEWATKIAIANLGVQALGIPANAKTLEKQELARKETIEQGRKAYTLQAAAIARQEARDEAARLEATRQYEERKALSAPRPTPSYFDFNAT